MENEERLFFGLIDVANAKKIKRENGSPLIFRPPKPIKSIEDFSDVWNDVQRRWMDLDGIFGGSGDVKALLPNETADFKSISSESLTRMEEVSKSPKVLKVLSVKHSHSFADRLGKLENALEEFLERQRASFPRSNFDDNKDLLEFIDIGNNIPVLTKHFERLFPFSFLISSPFLFLLPHFCLNFSISKQYILFFIGFFFFFN